MNLKIRIEFRMEKEDQELAFSGHVTEVSAPLAVVLLRKAAADVEAAYVASQSRPADRDDAG